MHHYFVNSIITPYFGCIITKTGKLQGVKYGSEAAKEANIYLIVKRDENGEIRKVKQITIEEAMEKFLD